MNFWAHKMEEKAWMTTLRNCGLGDAFAGRKLYSKLGDLLRETVVPFYNQRNADKIVLRAVEQAPATKAEASATKAPTTKAPARTAAAKKAPATAAAGTKASATAAAATAASAKKAGATTASAKKAAAKKASAKKAAAKKARNTGWETPTVRDKTFVKGVSWNIGYGGSKEQESDRAWHTSDDDAAMDELHRDIHEGLEWTSLFFKTIHRHNWTYVNPLPARPESTFRKYFPEVLSGKYFRKVLSECQCQMLIRNVNSAETGARVTTGSRRSWRFTTRNPSLSGSRKQWRPSRKEIQKRSNSYCSTPDSDPFRCSTCYN